MEALNQFNLSSLIDTAISLTTAFVLGSLIGLERQYRQRTAGLRTNTLVAVGAAVFVDMANRLNGHDGTLLRPVVNRINRRPVQESAGEATYSVYVVCDRANQAIVREKLRLAGQKAATAGSAVQATEKSVLANPDFGS